MNPVVKRMWLEALRSGEYKQVQSRLNKAGGMCCLGVLCDLASKNGLGSWEYKEDTNYFKVPGRQLEYLTLPPEVQIWAGLESDNPIISNEEDSDGDPITAAGANDSEGWSFAQIADAVEEFL